MRLDFEDNEVVMDDTHPTCADAQEKIEKAKAAKAVKAASALDDSVVNLKTKQDQLSYLLVATVRIEKSLATDKICGVEVCKGKEIAYFMKIYPSEASPSWVMAMVG